MTKSESHEPSYYPGSRAGFNPPAEFRLITTAGHRPYEYALTQYASALPTTLRYGPPFAMS